MTLLEEASRPFGDKRLTSGPSHLGKVSGSSSPGWTPIRAAHGSSASLTPQGFTVCSLHSLRSPNSTAPNKGPASVRRKREWTRGVPHTIPYPPASEPGDYPLRARCPRPRSVCAGVCVCWGM